MEEKYPPMSSGALETTFLLEAGISNMQQNESEIIEMLSDQ